MEGCIMDNQIKILIACGSGIATSTIAADEIKVICAEHNIKPQITKCSMWIVNSKLNNFFKGIHSVGNWR